MRIKAAAIVTFSDIISAILFFVAFALFIVGVVFRYGLNQPIVWSEELISTLFIWMVFWALSLSIGIKKQISFPLVYDSLSSRGRRIAALTASTLATVLFALAIPATLEFTSYIGRERTAALGIPLSFVYISFALFVISVPVRLLGRIIGLLSRQWSDFL